MLRTSDPLQVAQVVKSGGVIAYPTEAVWGLGCDPWQQQAVERLLALKSRPSSKGLILIAGDIEQIDFLLAKLAPQDYQKLVQSWPAAITWIVPHFGLVPDYLSGGRDTIALRVSAHPDVQAICKALAGPIVSTSANPSGRDPALDIEQIANYFPRDLDLAFEGELGGLEQPSRIFDLASGQQLR